LVTRIKDGGALAGVVLNPATPVETLDVILPVVDYVLVMSVNPGFGGQKFLPLALPKVEKLARRREAEGLNFKIQIDGGVTSENAARVVESGVDIIVSGSGIFTKDRSLGESVEQMRTAIATAF